MNIYTDWQQADGVKDVDEQVFVHTGYQPVEIVQPLYRFYFMNLFLCLICN